MRADQKVIRKNVLENERIDVGSYQIMGEKNDRGERRGKAWNHQWLKLFLFPDFKSIWKNTKGQGYFRDKRFLFQLLAFLTVWISVLKWQCFSVLQKVGTSGTCSQCHVKWVAPTACKVYSIHIWSAGFLLACDVWANGSMSNIILFLLKSNGRHHICSKRFSVINICFSLLISLHDML